MKIVSGSNGEERQRWERVRRPSIRARRIRTASEKPLRDFVHRPVTTDHDDLAHPLPHRFPGQLFGVPRRPGIARVAAHPAPLQDPDQLRRRLPPTSARRGGVYDQPQGPGLLTVGIGRHDLKIRQSGHGGGDVWESNPPTRVLAGHTGFEDQTGHQPRSVPALAADVLIGAAR